MARTTNHDTSARLRMTTSAVRIMVHSTRSTLAALLAMLKDASQYFDAADSARRGGTPAPAADVQKHYGYAFQWFALAAGIAFLYVWHRFIRPAKP